MPRFCSFQERAKGCASPVTGHNRPMIAEMIRGETNASGVNRRICLSTCLLGQQFRNGGKTYKLTVPPPVPAKLFWCVSLHGQGDALADMDRPGQRRPPLAVRIEGKAGGRSWISTSATAPAGRRVRGRPGGLQLGFRRHDLERRMPYRYAQELALFVRQPQGLARPALRIAGDLRIGKVSDNCQRLCAGGRSVRQLDPFLVRHDAMAEAEVEKIERHDPSPV
jgi:hypothetical protein